MDLYISSDFVSNLNEIVINQNRELLKSICNWKCWDYEKTLKDFQSNFQDLNLLEVTENSDNIETRIRETRVYNGNKYLLESISDNVYTLSGKFIGKKIDGDLETEVEED